MQVDQGQPGRWRIDTGQGHYLLSLDDGELRNLALGPTDTNPVPPWENPTNRDNLRLLRPEAAVFVGPRADLVRWADAQAEVTDNRLTLMLRGLHHPLICHWSLTLHPATAALYRETRIEHAGGAPVDIRGALSFSTLVPGEIQSVSYIAGAWLGEGQVRSIRPDLTPILLESRSGKTGFEYQPWLAVTTPGAVTLVQLAASANWHIHARHRADGLYVSGGLPEVGFQHELRAGEVIELPSATLIRCEGDLNAATQRLHDVRRDRQLAGRPLIPVQFNSWYPYPGVSRASELIGLLPIVRDLGCEIFVLDGSWFQNIDSQPEDTPFELTGDWMVHKESFPNGLRELSDACAAHGLRFGIWFEPESVGFSAQLHKTHPEWFHHVNGIARTGRTRGMLNLGIDAAREHIRDIMLDILRDTGATWIKWDFNEDLWRGGWAPGTPADLARLDPLYAHVQGVYRLQDELHAAMPDLLIEMCASGGGRFDAATLRRGHTQWMSDESHPLRNLSIHFGSHLAHPPELCNDWLIRWPPSKMRHDHDESPDLRGDFLFRLRVAMLGTLGISAKVGDWTAEEIAAARAEVDWYKAIARPLINDGLQYILTPQPALDGTGGWAAMAHVAKDASSAVAYVFRLESGESLHLLPLPGLDPAATYRLDAHGQAPRQVTGAALAEGLTVTLPETYRSTRLTATRVDHG